MTAAPPTSVMKSRRLIAQPQKTDNDNNLTQHQFLGPLEIVYPRLQGGLASGSRQCARGDKLRVIAAPANGSRLESGSSHQQLRSILG